MARYTFGGAENDYVFVKGSGNVMFAAPGSTLTFWSAVTGGSQYTDLLLNGGAVTTITADANGFVPLFSGPDSITTMYASADGSARKRMDSPVGSAGFIVEGSTRWDATKYGIDMSGVSASDTAFNALLALMKTGDILDIPHGSTIKLAARRDISKPITIEGNGATITQASTTGVFRVVTGGDGSIFRNINAVGPSASTYSANSKFVLIDGTLATYVTDVQLENVTGSNWGNATLWANFARRVTTRNVYTKTSVYAGQMFLSCEDLELWGPKCDTLAGNAGESYPIAFTRDSSQNMTNAPRTKHAQVHGGWAKNTTWEGLDCHAATDVKVFGYKTFATKHGIAFVGSPDTGGSTITYASQDCWAFGCTSESNVSNGTAGDGFSLIGALSLEQATGGFIGCTSIGYGTQGNITGGSGAVRLAATDGAQVIGLKAIEPSPFAVAMSADNYDTLIAGVDCTDAWSTSFAQPGAVGHIGNNNRATVSGVRMRHATKSATNLNKTGIYVNGTPTNVEFLLAGGNDFSIATTALYNFLPANQRVSIFGTKVGVQTLPSSGSVTAADVRAALIALGLAV